MRQLVRGEEWGNHIITSNKRRTIVDLMPTVYAVYKHIIALAREETCCFCCLLNLLEL